MYVSWGTIESWGVSGEEMINLRGQFGEEGIPVATESLVTLAQEYPDDLATYLPRLFKTPQACQRFLSRFSRQWPGIKSALGGEDRVAFLIQQAKQNPASTDLETQRANVGRILREAVAFGGDTIQAVELVGAAFNESVVAEYAI